MAKNHSFIKIQLTTNRWNPHPKCFSFLKMYHSHLYIIPYFHFISVLRIIKGWFTQKLDFWPSFKCNIISGILLNDFVFWTKNYHYDLEWHRWHNVQMIRDFFIFEWTLFKDLNCHRNCLKKIYIFSICSPALAFHHVVFVFP